MNEPSPPSDADLAALVDSQRGLDAARQRSSERWLRQMALEEARLSGLLVGLAEQQIYVLVRSGSGRSYSGTVADVGGDFVTLHTGAGAVVHVALSSVLVVQVDRGVRSEPATDDRAAPRTATLRDVLADEAGERPDATVFCAGMTDAIVGRLVAVGHDVATLEVDERRALAYVALDSVTEVSLRASG